MGIEFQFSVMGIHGRNKIRFVHKASGTVVK